jgi:SAM-dependent methyltransferase
MRSAVSPRVDTDIMGWDKTRADALRKELSDLYESKLQEEWRTPGRATPEWYDHHIDLHLWQEYGNGFWAERGAFAAQAMRHGDTVLDLACGDGFYEAAFYRNIATSITAIDLDPLAIAHACEYNSAPNVRFVVADLHDWLAEAQRRGADHRYDVVIMNAAIDHFDKDEIDETLPNVARLLRNGGIFVGCTIKGRRGQYEHSGRGHEFGALEELGVELKQHFPHVYLHSTNYGKGRVNYYWQASNEPTRRAGIFQPA